MTWTGGGAACDLSSGPRPVIKGGPPAQFDGTDETAWSPEHLILAALAQCLMATYFALNKRNPIETRAYASKAESVLDKTREGIVFTSFKIVVTVSVPADRVEDARKLIESAKKYCIISNALKTAPSVETVVDAF
ncbi:MAG: OsmC family protein [Elusimicrobiota bacterium]|nr:MAG: OsmC family protein [Elusimicrobiota bacterium]